MDNVQITQVDGEPPIFREMKPVPVTLESCILNSDDDFSYNKKKQASVSQDNHDDGELSAEEINSMIMINEGPNALSSAHEEFESDRAIASIRNSSDIKKILTSDLPKCDRFLSTKSLQKLSGAKKIIRKNSKYANEDETDVDDPVDAKVKKMLTKQSKTIKENLNKSNQDKIGCKNIKKSVKYEKLKVKSLKRNKKAETNKYKDLNLPSKVFKKKVLESNTAIKRKEIISKHEESEFETKKTMSKTTENVKKKSKTESKPKLLISRSGRIRKIKDVSDYVLSKNKEGKILNPEVDSAAMIMSSKDESEGKTEIVKEPIPNEAISKMESGKENKSQGDLLQSVLSESIESWFDISSDVEKKGKRARGKVKIIPKDFDDCFEETKNIQAEKNCEQIISENSEKIHTDLIKSEHPKDEEKDFNEIDEAKIIEIDTHISQITNKTSMDIIKSEKKSDIKEQPSCIEQSKDEDNKKSAALNGKKVKPLNRQPTGYKRKRRKARNICVTSYVKNYGERIDFDVKIEQEVEIKKKKNATEEIGTEKEINVKDEIGTEKEINATEEIKTRRKKNAAEEIGTEKKINATEEFKTRRKKNAAEEIRIEEEKNATEEIGTKKEKNATEEIKTRRKKNAAEEIRIEEEKNATEEIGTEKEKNATEEIGTRKKKNATEEIRIEEEKNTSEEIGTEKEKNATEEIGTRKKKNATEEIRIEGEKNTSEEIKTRKKKNAAEEIGTQKEKNAAEEIGTEKEKNATKEIRIEEEKNTTKKIRIEEEKNTTEEIGTEEEKNTIKKVKSKKEKNVTKEMKNNKQITILEEIETEKIVTERKKNSIEVDFKKQKNVKEETKNKKEKSMTEETETKKEKNVKEETETRKEKNMTEETETKKEKSITEETETEEKNIKEIKNKEQESELEETKSLKKKVINSGNSNSLKKRKKFELKLTDMDKSTNQPNETFSKSHKTNSLKRSQSAESLQTLFESESESPKKSAEMPASLPSRERELYDTVKDCFVMLKKENEDNDKNDDKKTLKNEDKDQKVSTRKNPNVESVEREEVSVLEEQKEKKIEKVREINLKDEEVQTDERMKFQKKKRKNAFFTKVIGMKSKRKQMWRLARQGKFSYKKRNWPLKKQAAEEPKNSNIVNKNASSNVSDNKENGKVIEDPNKKQETRESFSTSSVLSIPLKKRPRRTKLNETLDENGKENKEETNDCERRKSHREIKLTPKIVDMIAISFSHKRYRKSSSFKEESTIVKEETESKNSAQKLAIGSEAKSRLSEQLLETTVPSVENYLQSKMEANASNFESSWEPGDLVWARFAGNPFWPALILRDPFSNDEYSRVKYLGRLPRPFVHVQFLADYGRRAWGPELYIMTFNGLEEFEKLKSSLPEVNAFTQRKDLVYQQAFFTPKKLERNWVEAVKEADTLIDKSKDERITYMKIKYPLVKYAASVANGRLVPNTKCGESKLPQSKTRGRKKKSCVSVPRVWPADESKDTFECVNTSDMDEGVEKSVKESPKITLKLVRSPRKGSKRKSLKSVDEIEEKKYKKRIKKEILDDDYVPSDSGSNGERGSDTSANKQKKYFLFKGARAEKVCQICVEILENEKTIKCKGPCQGLFHKSCAEKMSANLPPLEEGLRKGIKYKRRKKLFTSGDSDNSTDTQSKESGEKEWRCNDCLRGQNPCFVCNSRSGNRQRCCVAYCGKFYHQKCLKLYPQTIYNQGAPIRKSQSLQQSKTTETESPHYQILSCPLHVCHTCASDNPADFNMKYLCEKLVKCIKCPSAYHGGNYCVPAGSTILNTSQIICAKHGDPGKKSHVNISWCFICNMGGSLICCEWCPSSFHLDCLNLKPPDGPYICEECESGRFPLYGEVVWVKLGRYRWWPARILFPQEILPNIMALPHKSWEFAVRFYGSNDHYWLNRGRVFLYQEGDSEQKFKGQSHVDKIYQRAVQDATKDYFAIQEERKSRLLGTTTSGVMKPPPYVKIKTNKAVGKVQLGNLSQSEPQTCDCDPQSEAPCSPGSDCLNRMLLVECNPNYCNAGPRCGNQSFEKREYPPLEPYRTKTRGWGLRSCIDIPKGAFVIEYVGEVVDDEEFKRRMKRKQETKDSNYYFLTIDKDRMIDAGPKGNLARFMNHSCSPNCETQKWTVNGDTRVGLFALRDIPAGTELTFNYNLDCIGNEKKPCHCEEENCSGFIGIKAKNDKSESLKNKMMKRLEKESEDECFVCNDGGELMVCDVPNCPKVYHVECVNLTSWPNELWFCPRHRCSLCSRTTKRCCKLCPTAYCFAHLDNNIFPDNQGGLLCSKHSTCAVKPAQILRKASYVNRNTPIIEYEKPFAEKYRPPPQKERTSPEEKKEEILMEPNLTDNTPIVVENPLLSTATPGSLRDGVSVQVLYVDEEGQIISVDESATLTTAETSTTVCRSEEMPKPVKRRRRTNIPRKKLNPPVMTEEIENKKKSPTQGGINFESLMIKSVEDKILDSKLNMDNIYNIIGGGGGGNEGERETGQSDSAERCIRDDSNDLKSETVSKKDDAEVDRSRRSKYFKIITPEKFIKVSESESNQKKVTDFNYIEFMHPLRSARSKTKTDENTRK